MQKVRTRIAPSPTGGFHIGNFRTALYSYIWAKKTGGNFILRIEDTDRKRFVEGSAESLVDLFGEFDIKFDEKPTEEQFSNLGNISYPRKDWLIDDTLQKIDPGDFADVYIQTQRLPIYLKYAQELIEKGFAYACFCSEERLAAMREQQKSSGAKLGYDGFCRNIDKDEVLARIQKGEEYVIRMNVNEYMKRNDLKEVEYEDLFLGKMKFDLSEVDDQVIVKSNGIPTYHLAVVVDDYLMQITHPFRGYGWLPSTPKQVLLYRMLGWEMPPFGHGTDILDPKGGKLSKRKGAVFVDQFLQDGYLPEAIINFIVLLGWTPNIKREHGEKEREIFSIEEIIDLFELEDVNVSNPVFNREKLLWYNQQYMRDLDDQKFFERFQNWVEKYSSLNLDFKGKLKNEQKDVLIAKVNLVRGRTKTLSEIPELIRFFYDRPESIDWSIKQIQQFRDKLDQLLRDVKDVMLSLEEDSANWQQEEWVEKMKSIAEKYDLKTGDPFMVLRLAVVGSPFSPPLFEAMQILGKEEVLNRLNNAKN